MDAKNNQFGENISPLFTGIIPWIRIDRDPVTYKIPDGMEENLNLHEHIGQLIFTALQKKKTKKAAAKALGIGRKELEKRMAKGGIAICPISRRPLWASPEESKAIDQATRQDWYDKKLELLNETFNLAMSVCRDIEKFDPFASDKGSMASYLLMELKECINTQHKTGIKALKKTLAT